VPARVQATASEIMSTTAKTILTFLLAAGGMATAATAAAQHYPTRPVRFIVPAPPGGGLDIVARTLAQKLAEPFGQSVAVDTTHTEFS
jgi:tripartite-type tricarboxylate transporter receptor subunit TctC